MIYCIDPTADEPIMLINKHIGFDEEEGQGVDGSIFQQELLQLDCMNKKRIQVWINSSGGVVTDGYNIFSAILKSVTPVDTYCIGAAASIAGVIFQAGRKRIMSDYGWLMYHNPFGGDNNDALKTIKESIIKMVSQRCEMTAEQVGVMMNKDTFILADEAKAMKLCDIVQPTETENTKYLRTITNASEFHKECNKVLNSLLKPKTNNMIKVCNKLSLNNDASEESIVKAIEVIENKVIAATEQVATLELEVQNKATEEEKLRAKMAKLNEELENCKSSLKEMQEAKDLFEKETKEGEAKNAIEGYAKIGRITNTDEVKAQWLPLMVNDLEGTKKIIEALPINKASVSIEQVANKVEGLPTTAVGLMAQMKLNRQKK